MIGITHLTAGLCVGVLSAPSLLGLAGMLVGARLPDQIDFFIAGRSRPLFEKIHRKTSHNLFWWTIALVSVLFIGQEILPHPAFVFSVWMLFGVMVHLLLDSFTRSGIPALPFREEKIGLRFCYTKGPFDYGLCLALGFFSCYWLLAQGGLLFFKNNLF